jgi:hypothetical protein
LAVEGVSNVPDYSYIKNNNLKPIWESGFGYDKKLLSKQDDSVKKACNIAILKHRVLNAESGNKRFERRMKSV